MKVSAYYLGGPRDGEMVPESLLNCGPMITIPIDEPPPMLGRDAELPTDPFRRTHTYREAPTMRVGNVAEFRFFVSETFPTLGGTMHVLAHVIETAMEHRRWSRR